jgi:hypothetical protein
MKQTSDPNSEEGSEHLNIRSVVDANSMARAAQQKA